MNELRMTHVHYPNNWNRMTPISSEFQFVEWWKFNFTYNQMWGANSPSHFSSWTKTQMFVCQFVYHTFNWSCYRTVWRQLLCCFLFWYNDIIFLHIHVWINGFNRNFQPFYVWNFSICKFHGSNAKLWSLHLALIIV